MFVNLKFLILLSILILTACGGGASNSPIDTKSEFFSEYEGKKLQAEVNLENYKKIVQSLHYLFDNSELDDKEQLSSVVDGRVVKQNINKQTGLGTILYTYKNFQIRNSEDIWTGSIKLNIMEINKISNIVKFNVTYDLNIEKFNDEISFFIRIDSTIDTKNQKDSLIIKEYRLKSKKNQLDTEVVNLEYDETVLKKGRIYIASEGYIDFNLTNSGYEMVDVTNSKTVVKYLNEEIVLNGQIDKKLYYKGNRVAYSPFPIIQYEYIDLNNTLIDTNLTVLHTTNKDTFTHQNAKWYVNGKKIKEIDNIKLSRIFFKKTDNIKVVLGIYNDDACSVKVIENYQVPNAKPIVTIIKNHNNPYDSTSIIQTNTLEFEMNIFNIFDADGDKINLIWSVPNYEQDKVSIVSGTNYLEHPTVSLSNYDTVLLNVEIKEENGISYSEFIRLDVRTDIFKTEIYKYSKFYDYSNVKALAIEDMNGDGLKDMVVVLNGISFDNNHLKRIEIFYQDLDNNFTMPQVFSINNTLDNIKTSLILKDINNDGLIDIALNYNKGVVIYTQTNVQTFVESSTHILGTAISSLVATDFNNDKKIDFIALTNKNEPYLENLKMDFLKQENGDFNLNSTIDEANISFGSQLKLGDFNGDNKDDILIVSNKNGAKIQMYLNNSKEKKIYTISADINNRYIGYNTIVVSDLNDDGYDDIIFGVGLSYATSYLHQFEDIQKDIYVMYSTGSSGVLNSPVKLNIEIEDNYEVLKIADINGDSQKDILIYKDTNVIAYVNDNGMYSKYPRGISIINSYYPLRSNHMSVTDINNDGLDDIIIAPNDKNELLIGISKF